MLDAGPNEAGLVREDHGLVRSRRPSFASTCATCVLTVCSLTTSSAAISAFERPRASSRSTSASRSVSASSAGGGAAPLSRPAKRSISRRVTAGAKREPPSATTLDRREQLRLGRVLEQEAARAGAERRRTRTRRGRRSSARARAAARPATTICRVASIPSTRGMRTSISTTSGSQRRVPPRPPRRRRGLADDLELRVRAEDHPEPGPDEPLVVGEQDADHSGSRARTAKPPSGAGPLASSPPKTATRSRMPSRPCPPPSPLASPPRRRRPRARAIGAEADEDARLRRARRA